MRRQISLFILTLFWAQSLVAQDPVFSQFYAAPLQLNPAFAGTTLAPRVTANYRSQWLNWAGGAAYSTYAVSYEQSVEGLNSGFGFTVMGDDAGQGIYQSTRASAIYGYQVKMREDVAIKFGLELGMIQTTLDWDRLIFVDQLDPINGSRDPAGNPYETAETRPDNLNKVVADVAVGALIYGGPAYFGISAKHLNSPDQSLLEINQNLSAGLPVRLTIQGGAEFPLKGGNKRWSPSFISPNLLYIKQGDFGQVTGGAYVGLGNLFWGGWYRHGFANGDAAIALVGVKEGVFRFGYSFDMTLSGLNNARGGTGGSHEISLTINFDDSKALQRKRKRSRYNDCFKMFH